MAVTRKESNRPQRRGAPATTVEGRENQMISLAIDLAEKQLLQGTASSQVIAHFLKLGTTVARLEKEKLERETALLRAKEEQLKSQKKTEELYRDALKAMQRYSGGAHTTEETDEIDDFDE